MKQSRRNSDGQKFSFNCRQLVPAAEPYRLRCSRPCNSPPPHFALHLAVHATRNPDLIRTFGVPFAEASANIGPLCLLRLCLTQTIAVFSSLLTSQASTVPATARHDGGSSALACIYRWTPRSKRLHTATVHLPSASSGASRLAERYKYLSYVGVDGPWSWCISAGRARRSACLFLFLPV